MPLAEMKCVPCHGGIPPLPEEECKKNLSELQGWQLEGNQKISKVFKFKDFKEAISFVNKIAEIAEAEQHHPDIKINYNRVAIELSTHAIKGLSTNDFIMAAKIENVKV